MADDPTTSQQSSGLIIPDEVRTAHPELIDLIIGSESMNNEERQYWINILPIMTPDQIQNLREILLNEKKQLAAIDKKYSKEIEQIGQAQLIKKTEEERRKHREERQKKEEMDDASEQELEDDILQQIADA